MTVETLRVETLRENAEKALERFEDAARLASISNINEPHNPYYDPWVGMVDGLPVIAADEFAGIWFPMFVGIDYSVKDRPIEVPQYLEAVKSIKRDYHVEADAPEHTTMGLKSSLDLVIAHAKHDTTGDIYKNFGECSSIMYETRIGYLYRGDIPDDKTVGKTCGVRFDLRPLQTISMSASHIYFGATDELKRNGIKAAVVVNCGILIFYFGWCYRQEPAAELLLKR